MRANIDGKEYEIQLYRGKHSSEYLLSEMEDGKIEGRCQLFNHGILSLSWIMKNGKRVGDITEYENGKVLRKESWDSIFLKNKDRRIIENTKEGLVMTIREDEIVVYRGGFDEEMNRCGHGVEYDIENGKEKIEGYWEKDKLVRIIREFDADQYKMVEYVVNSNLEVWNRIPVYIGEYCNVNGTYLRHGIGYCIDQLNGTAFAESEWEYGVEKKGTNLYEGWYMKGMQESIRSVLKNRKPVEIKNEATEVTGEHVMINNSRDLMAIDMRVNDLTISNSSCNDIPELHLTQYNWLQSIEIGYGCFISLKTFEVNGLNRLKSLKIGNNSFGNTSLMNLSNLISLESIEIGDGCFNSLKTFKIDGLNRLKSLKIGQNSFTQKNNRYGNDKSKSFHILNCESLKSIEIGQYSFSDFGGQFELKNLPSLQSIKIGTLKRENGYGFGTNTQYYSYNFYYSSFVIGGILNDVNN